MIEHNTCMYMYNIYAWVLLFLFILLACVVIRKTSDAFEWHR